MTITHLDSLEESPMLMHVFENIRLQVSIDDKNCDACNVLECLLVCPYNLLHSFKRHLGNKHLLDVLIDHLDFLDVYPSGCIATKCTERIH